ncbi:MAG: hypothetical protein KJO34_03005 [Deltaproteobacteria bacterium]|nr:hypothetical protein [Deltaproteobacteria bacterium]
MVKCLRTTIANFPDKRTGKNTRYSLEDAALGAFSVFFTQSPSFLSFQNSMQKAKGKSNAQTLFAMDKEDFGLIARKRYFEGPTDVEWDLDNSFAKSGSLLELILGCDETKNK